MQKWLYTCVLIRINSDPWFCEYTQNLENLAGPWYQKKLYWLSVCKSKNLRKVGPSAAGVGCINFVNSSNTLEVLIQNRLITLWVRATPWGGPILQKTVVLDKFCEYEQQLGGGPIRIKFGSMILWGHAESLGGPDTMKSCLWLFLCVRATERRAHPPPVSDAWFLFSNTWRWADTPKQLYW
jgi:hypothetical protein